MHNWRRDIIETLLRSGQWSWSRRRMIMLLKAFMTRRPCRMLVMVGHNNFGVFSTWVLQVVSYAAIPMKAYGIIASTMSTRGVGSTIGQPCPSAGDSLVRLSTISTIGSRVPPPVYLDWSTTSPFPASLSKLSGGGVVVGGIVYLMLYYSA